MDHKEVQMMAAEFVLGTLNRAMLLQFKNELSQNPALREAVKDWERRLGMGRGGLLMHPRKPKAVPVLRETPGKNPAFSNKIKRMPERNGDKARTPLKIQAPADSDPILDAQTQRDVQAALEQISLDSTLASRVRCGQMGQRVTPSPRATKPAVALSGTGLSESTARALAPEALEAGPEAVGEQNARQAESPQENPTPQKTSEPQELSRAQAASKALSVLKAAQNLLAKQDPPAKEPSDTPEEAPDRKTPSVLRAEDGEWEALAPRVYKKQLNRDDNFNRQSYLLRMIPGGRVQPLRQGGIEEVYVVEGRLAIGGNTLGPGDFQAFTVKGAVPEITAAGDSLILVRGHIADRIPDPEGAA